MGIELRVLCHGASLIRILGEQLARPSDEAGRRLVSGSAQETDIAEDLVAGECADRSVAVGELGREQFRDQVVGRIRGPPVDVLRVVGGAEVLRRGGDGHDALLQAEALVDLVPKCLLVLLGDAQQHADRAHRDLCAQVRDEIEAALPDEGVESPGRIPAHLRLDRSETPGREHAAQEPAVQVVIRRVLEDEHARRQLDARLDDLDDGALGRAVGLPLDAAPLDVGVAADREEVVLLVVVERRFVT